VNSPAYCYFEANKTLFMGINESKINNGKPDIINIIQLLPECVIKDFYVKYDGSDNEECNSITNACRNLVPVTPIGKFID
jgi:hypothetical protein